MCPEVFGGAEEQQGLSPGAWSLARSGAAHLRNKHPKFDIGAALDLLPAWPLGQPRWLGQLRTPLAAIPWLPEPLESIPVPDNPGCSPLSNFQIRHLGSRGDEEAAEGRLVLSIIQQAKQYQTNPKLLIFSFLRWHVAVTCSLLRF